VLRSERQVALHDVLEALAVAAGRYEDAATALGQDAAATLCRRLARRRAALAARMEAALRQAGDLPSEPDADRETLGRLGSRLRALLSDAERPLLIRERLAAEEELLRLAEHAAGLALEPAWQGLLEQVRQEAARAVRQLREFAASP